MGPLATADFLRKLAEETPAQRDQDHIPYVACGVPQIPDRPPAITGNGESPLPHMLDGIAKLRQAGARAIAIPCNTAHYWYDDLVREGGLPVLHIADAVCVMLAGRGITSGTVGLVCTEGTVKAGFFQRRFSARGLTCITCDPDVQNNLVLPAIAHVKANRLEIAHQCAIKAVENLQAAGAEAVVLACTETPLAVEHLPNPAAGICIDATRALARACVAWHRDTGRL